MTPQDAISKLRSGDPVAALREIMAMHDCPFGISGNGDRQTVSAFGFIGTGATRIEAIEAWISGARNEPFCADLTPAGEQLVIPGCEKDAEQTGVTQLSLF